MKIGMHTLYKAKDTGPGENREELVRRGSLESYDFRDWGGYRGATKSKKSMFLIVIQKPITEENH